jgi:outer membrane protein OmpA-like peptidoglycan-associated protein
VKRFGPVVGLMALLAPMASWAQVNRSALDRLGPAAPKHAHPAPHQAHQAHPASGHPASAHGHAHAAAGRGTQAPGQSGRTGSVASRIGKAPVIPLHPPAPPVIAPAAVNVPLHPPAPPPPVPVDAKAVGTVSPIQDGLRLTFGADSAAVNDETDKALHGVATMMKAEPATVADIEAYAAGTEDDPSSSRRLSLQRALAARAVLINDGVASTRIYARALGTGAAPATDPAPDGPADRLDVTLRDPYAPAKPAQAGRKVDQADGRPVGQ